MTNGKQVKRNWIQRVLGLKKKKQRAPEYQAPQDITRTATIAGRLRSLTMQAEQNGITLQGTLQERRKQVLTALDGDDYDTAEPLVNSLERDVDEAVNQLQRFTKNYGAIEKRIEAVLDWPDNQISVELRTKRGELRNANGKITDEQDTGNYAKALELMGSLGLVGKVTAAETAKQTSEADKQQLGIAYGAYAARIKELLALGDDISKDLRQKTEELRTAHSRFVAKRDNHEYADARRLIYESLISATNAAHSAKYLFDRDKKGWEALFPQVNPEYQKMLKLWPEKTSTFRATMGFASEQAGEHEYPKAVEVLKRLQSMLKESMGEQADVQALGVNLKQLRLKAIQGVGELESKLTALPDESPGKVAVMIKKLGDGLPTEIEGKLENLNKAIKAKDAQNVTKFKKEVNTAVQNWLAYLQSNASFIQACEKNPWKIAIAMESPVKAALKAILKQTAA